MKLAYFSFFLSLALLPYTSFCGCLLDNLTCDVIPNPCSSTGVVSAVVFITLCVVAVMTRFLYQHRQAQRDANIKEKEHRHNLETAYRREAAYQAEPVYRAESAYRTELHLHDSATLRDNREYYI